LKIWVGIFPVKLELLALTPTRLFITSHVVYENCHVKVAQDVQYCKGGKAPHIELRERLRWCHPGRLPRDRERRTLRATIYWWPSCLKCSWPLPTYKNPCYPVIVPLGIGEGNPYPKGALLLPRAWAGGIGRDQQHKRKARQKYVQYLALCLLWKLKCMQPNQLQI
jgi:hypothetical protein